MIRENRTYQYNGRNLAYYGTRVLVVKVNGRFADIKLSNGVILPNIPLIHLKDEKEKNH